MNQAVTNINGDDKRSAALLKAIGLDRVPPEQRELAMAIADRYELDLMLKHVVLIDGRPYITRDGLLHIAHRSGAFDGMEVTDPIVMDVGPGKFWTARCSVWRKDMTRPFTYAGRYPTTGGNQKFAPEMAVKVAEVMALRRAFDVSAPVLEERWDMDAASPDPEPPRTTAETIAARRATIAPTTSAPPAVPPASVASQGGDAPAAEPLPEGSASGGGDADVIEGVAVETPAQCESMSPYDPPSRCAREDGHKAMHKNRDRESWQ